MKKALSRRTVIQSAAVVPALVPLVQIGAQTSKALSPGERKMLEALLDRIIPKDENGPGAVEAGAAEYIDRALAGYLANEKTAFTNGLAAADALARSTQGAGLAQLAPEKRDSLLAAMDSSSDANLRGFFARLRRLTLEGMFGDPSYGGNVNFAGWDLIGYPGAKMASTPEDQRMKTPAKKTRKALYKEPAHANH